MPPLFTDHLHHLSQLRAAALRAADPAAAVQRALMPADFADAERVFVVGAGKAGVAMTQAAAKILGERLTRAVVAAPYAPAQAPNRVAFVEGGHPAPTPGSLAAGRAVADLLTGLAPRDLVIVLLSGGGSALLELPHAGLSLEDFQVTTAALLKCGATVNELNLVRTQLSQLKGGGLARLAYPARILTLILSDVVGSPLDVIASGPTAPTPATRRDALVVIDKYGLRPLLPETVLSFLQAGGGPMTEDVGPAQPVHVVINRLIGSNRLAGEAAAAEAERLGFRATFLADDWQGEAQEVGRRFAEAVISVPTLTLAHSLTRTGAAGGSRCCVVGGESTVTVRGSGKGGRNTEAALAAALAMDGVPNIVIATFATDGVDGPTDAAGAVVRGDTAARARALGLDPQTYLDSNDSYTFFAALGDLIVTGPTGTNVNDLMFGLVY